MLVSSVGLGRFGLSSISLVEGPLVAWIRMSGWF
jgi:hypothetical protein